MRATVLGDLDAGNLETDFCIRGYLCSVCFPIGGGLKLMETSADKVNPCPHCGEKVSGVGATLLGPDGLWRHMKCSRRFKIDVGARERMEAQLEKADADRKELATIAKYVLDSTPEKFKDAANCTVEPQGTSCGYAVVIEDQILCVCPNEEDAVYIHALVEFMAGIRANANK